MISASTHLLRFDLIHLIYLNVLLVLRFIFSSSRPKCPLKPAPVGYKIYLRYYNLEKPLMKREHGKKERKQKKILEKRKKKEQEQ